MGSVTCVPYAFLPVETHVMAALEFWLQGILATAAGINAGGGCRPPQTLPWKSSPVLEVELLGVTSPRGDKSRVDVGRFFNSLLSQGYSCCSWGTLALPPGTCHPLALGCDKSRVDVGRFFFILYSSRVTVAALWALLGALGTPWGALGALWGVLGAL